MYSETNNLFWLIAGSLGVGLLGGFLFGWWTLLALGVCLVVWVMRTYPRAMFLLLVFVYTLGVIRGVEAQDKTKVAFGSRVDFVGFVSSSPQQTEYNTSYTVRPIGIDTDVLVRSGVGDAVAFGDGVHITGILEQPESFVTDTNTVFDYSGYLERRNIVALMNKPHIVPTDVELSWWQNMRKVLMSWKMSIEKRITFTLGEPAGSLANGILLGEKKGLPRAVSTDLKRAGLSHIAVLSGYNISIVIFITLLLLSFLPRTFAVVGTLCITALFVIFVGAEPSILRAALMGAVSLGALQSGRAYSAGRALIVSGLVLLWINPDYFFDVSFQLSFMATLGIIILNQPLVRILTHWRLSFFWAELISVPLAAQLFVSPILLYQMNSISLFSLFPNMLIASVMPIAMLVALLAGLGLGFSFFVPIFVFPFTYILFVAHIFSILPGNYIVVPHISAIVLWLLYGLLFVFGRWLYGYVDRITG